MPIENRLLGVKSLLLFLTHKVLLRKQQSSWNSKRYFPTERNPRIESGTYNAMSDFRIFVFVAWKTCCEREVKLSNLIKPLFVDLSHTVTSRFLFFSTPLLCCSTCYLIFSCLSVLPVLHWCVLVYFRSLSFHTSCVFVLFSVSTVPLPPPL